MAELNDVTKYTHLSVTPYANLPNWSPGYITCNDCKAEGNIPVCRSGFSNRPEIYKCDAYLTESSSGCKTLGFFSARECKSTSHWVRICKRNFPSGYSIVNQFTAGSIEYERALCDKCCLVSSEEQRKTNGCPLSYKPPPDSDLKKTTIECYGNNVTICSREGLNHARCRLDRLALSDLKTLSMKYCVEDIDKYPNLKTRMLELPCKNFYHLNIDEKVQTFLRQQCANETKDSAYKNVCGCFLPSAYYDNLYTQIIRNINTLQSATSIDPQIGCWYPDCANASVKPQTYVCAQISISQCIQEIDIEGLMADDVDNLNISNECNMIIGVNESPLSSDESGWILGSDNLYFQFQGGTKYIQTADRKQIYYISDLNLQQFVFVLGDRLAGGYEWTLIDTDESYSTNVDGVVYYSDGKGAYWYTNILGTRFPVSGPGAETETDYVLWGIIGGSAVFLIVVIVIIAVASSRKKRGRRN